MSKVLLNTSLIMEHNKTEIFHFTRSYYPPNHSINLSQMVTYLVCDGLEYRFKVLIGRVRQVTKDVIKSEV